MTDAVETGAASATPLDVLIQVQDRDTVIAQLQHRRANLPERVELGAVEAALGALEGRGRELEGPRQELLGRQAELEEQIEGVAGRRRSLEDRLYGSRGSAARDLQAMDEEIRHLAERRDELEEQELTLMEEQEPLDGELATLAAERGRLESSAEVLRGAVADAETVVDAELAAELRRPVRARRRAPERSGRPLRVAPIPARRRRRGPAGRQPLRRLPPGAPVRRGRTGPPAAAGRRWRRATSAAGSSSGPEAGRAAVLVLVRHGQATANAAGLLLGRSDAPLTAEGRRQAEALGAYLAAPRP